MLVKIVAAVLAPAVLIAGAASAQEVTFNVQNRSSLPITGMFIKSGSKWSQTWIKNTPIGPGETRAMTMSESWEDCSYYTAFRFSNKVEFNKQIDYCTTETIVVDNKGVKFYFYKQ